MHKKVVVSTHRLRAMNAAMNEIDRSDDNEGPNEL